MTFKRSHIIIGFLFTVCVCSVSAEMMQGSFNKMLSDDNEQAVQTEQSEQAVQPEQTEQAETVAQTEEVAQSDAAQVSQAEQ